MADYDKNEEKQQLKQKDRSMEEAQNQEKEFREALEAARIAAKHKQKNNKTTIDLKEIRKQSKPLPQSHHQNVPSKQNKRNKSKKIVSKSQTNKQTNKSVQNQQKTSKKVKQSHFVLDLIFFVFLFASHLLF